MIKKILLVPQILEIKRKYKLSLFQQIQPALFMLAMEEAQLMVMQLEESLNQLVRL